VATILVVLFAIDFHIDTIQF